MTDRRTLADTIARAIAEQIESSRSIIVQNMADVIHDALLLDGAKRDGGKWSTDRPKEVDAFQWKWKEKHPNRIPERDLNWGSLKNWWQDEVDDYGASIPRPRANPWAI